MKCPSNGVNYSRGDYWCLFDKSHRQNVKFEFAGENLPQVQDIDLRFKENAVFRVGKPREIIQAWVAGRGLNIFAEKFSSEFWDILQDNLMYFSEPEKKNLALGLGASTKYVRMKIWSTVIVVIVVILFFAYCITSLIMRYDSGIRTGIRSECITRAAVMELLRQETELKGKPFPRGSEHSFTIKCQNVGSARKRIRHISVHMGEES